MLKIRPEQMRVFDKKAERDFELRMVQHAKKYFPNESKNFDDKGILIRIRAQMEQARCFNIVDKKDVCDYISLSFSLGDNFCERADLPWAKDIVNNPTVASGTTRMAKLNKKTMAYLRIQEYKKQIAKAITTYTYRRPNKAVV